MSLDNALKMSSCSPPTARILSAPVSLYFAGLALGATDATYLIETGTDTVPSKYVYITSASEASLLMRILQKPS